MSSETRSSALRTIKIKQERENELQSYLNSFNKEIENESGPSSKKNFITQEELDAEDYHQIIEEGDDNNDDFKYVLIVQDEDEGAEEKNVGQVYEFDEDDMVEGLDEEMGDDKSKIVLMGLKKDQSLSTGGQAHRCSYCNYTTPKRYLLARHMKCHSEDRPHKCSVCERGFKTVASLTNHVNTHTGTKPHSCKFCPSAFTTSGELVRHVRYRHTHEKPHKCTECDYASVELSKLKRHIRCHTGERPYQCPHCTYASPDTFKLKRHLRVHTGEKPYECDVCHARFTQSNSLKAHKLIHSVGEKPVFQCELCPTTCGRKTDLRIHVQKLHTSEVPIKCKRCGTDFPDRYTYKLHAKTHEGEKCYRCEVCPYASISARHLESHLLIHTDQKPYMCTFCDQSFRQKQLLKRHENIYHNPDYVASTPKEKCHKCPTCKKTFRHKGNLMRHMASHDPNVKQERDHKNGTVSQIRFKREAEDEDEEFYEGEEDDEEDEMEQEIGDNPDDGYVVVEVIQMANGGEELGDEQYVDEDVVEEDMNEMEEILEEDTDGHTFTLDEHIDDEVIMSLKQTPRHQGDEQDISSFIGFETDSDNEDGKRLKQTILGN